MRYADKMTSELTSVGAGDVETLREAGWSDTAIHDAAQIVAYFNYINRIADGLGVDEEPGLPVWGRAHLK